MMASCVVAETSADKVSKLKDGNLFQTMPFKIFMSNFHRVFFKQTFCSQLQLFTSVLTNAVHLFFYECLLFS